jgi:hypothetical protein
MQIAKPHYRESTATDVAADVIAGGGSLMGAAKEGLAFQAQKSKAEFKRAIDPLNIVHKITGGSKLATALSGRLLGRSEKSIRSAAGLAEREDPYSTEPVSPDMLSPRENQGSTLDQDNSTHLLDQMTKTLALIALRVTDIAVKLKATKDIKVTSEGRLRDANTGKFASGAMARAEERQTQYLKELRDITFAENRGDARRADLSGDKFAEEQYKQRFGKPTRVDGAGKALSGLAGNSSGKTGDSGKPSGGLFETISGWFKSLSGSALEFGAALGLLSRPFSMLKGLVTGFFEMFKAGIQTIPKMLENVPNVIKGAGQLGSSLVKGVKGIAGTVVGASAGLLGTAASAATKGATTGAMETAGKVATGAGEVATKGIAAATPAIKELNAASKVTQGVAGAERVASKSKVLGVLKNLAPKVLKSKAASIIPVVGTAMGLYFAAQRLMKGDLVGAGIDAAGALPIPGASIPAIVTSLVRDAYTEIYSPKNGPPVYPEQDPLAPERLPEMMELGKQTVSAWLSGEAAEKEQQGSPTAVAGVTGVSGPTSVPSTPPTVVAASGPATSIPQSVQGGESSVSPRISEMPASPPQTGGALMAAREFQRDAAPQAERDGGAGMTNLTKVNNNNINNTSVFPGMASPRSAESTWLRVTSRDYVPT